MSDFARCRSCGAKVIWTITVTGKRMPVDAEPCATGNLYVFAPDDPQGALESVPVSSADPRAVKARDRSRFVSHFATCPAADSHRRARVPLHRR